MLGYLRTKAPINQQKQIYRGPRNRKERQVRGDKAKGEGISANQRRALDREREVTATQVLQIALRSATMNPL